SALAGHSAPYEYLGQRVISGHLATGTRITAPNTRGMPVGTVVTEVWTADDIGLPVLTIQKSPAGETIQKYENIHVGDPDTQVFTIPLGYTVSQRVPASATAPSRSPE